MAAHAALYLLWALLLLLGAAGPVAGQTFPACPLLSIQMRTSRSTIGQGGKNLIKVKISNRARAPITDVVVRLDLPAGLVAFPKSSTDPVVANGPGGTSFAYWVRMSLPAWRGRILKLRLRSCATAAPGTYTVPGAVYLVNATDDVTCLNSASPSAFVSGLLREGRARMNMDHGAWAGATTPLLA